MEDTQDLKTVFTLLSFLNFLWHGWLFWYMTSSRYVWCHSQQRPFEDQIIKRAVFYLYLMEWLPRQLVMKKMATERFQQPARHGPYNILNWNVFRMEKIRSVTFGGLVDDARNSSSENCRRIYFFSSFLCLVPPPYSPRALAVENHGHR